MVHLQYRALEYSVAPDNTEKKGMHGSNDETFLFISKYPLMLMLSEVEGLKIVSALSLSVSHQAYSFANN